MKNTNFRIVLIILILSSFLVYSGCATIFSGSRDQIALSSEPAGAKVLVNGQDRGKTPVTLSLKKGKEYMVDFVKDGYEKKSIMLTYSLGAGWLILDILAGIIGVLVDALTGNWNSLDYESYKAILEPVK
jgi:uncharacterized protein YceK